MSATVPVLQDRQYPVPAGSVPDPAICDTAWVYGDKVELTPALAADSVLLGISAYTQSFPGDNCGAQIGLYKGAEGVETLVAEFRTRMARLVNDPGSSGQNFLPTIIGIDNLSAGDRVSVAARDSGDLPDGWVVKAGIIQKPLAGRLAMTTGRQKCLPNGVDDFTLTTSATPWAFTGWQTIREASGPTLYLTLLNIAQTIFGVIAEIEIGTGDTESDMTVIHRLCDAGGRRTDLIGSGQPRYNPLFVPADTRVAWRVRCDRASATTYYLSATYVESFLEWFEQSGSE